MDEHIKAARNLITPERMAPPWDEDREAAILSKVLDSVADHATDAKAGRHGRATWRSPAVVGSVAAFLVAVAAGVTLGLWPMKARDRLPPPASVLASASDIPNEPPLGKPSEIKLAPGTRALLDAGSMVTTLLQTDTLISLQQESGRVFYEVNPDAQQKFQVRVQDVLVEVIGTKFFVEVTNLGVRVEVIRGAVKVGNNDRNLILRDGESVLLTSGGGTGASDASAPGVDEPNSPDGADGDTIRDRMVVRTKPAPDTVEGLFSAADEARKNGQLSQAERALRRITAEFAGDPRSTTALFSLARVQWEQGKAAAAADTFAEVQKRAQSSLREDALAEEAVSRAQAGQRQRSVALIQEYLRRHPAGIHRNRLEKLLPQQ